MTTTKRKSTELDKLAKDILSTPKTKKPPRTIKVSTLLKALAITLAIVLAFTAGIFTARAIADHQTATRAEAYAQGVADATPAPESVPADADTQSKSQE